MVEIFIIFIMGLIFNGALFMLPGLQNVLQNAIKCREICILITIIFVLLVWPNGTQQVYEQSTELGMARIIRVMVLLIMFLYLLLRNTPLPKSYDLGLLSFAGYVLLCFISSIYAPSFFETIWKSFEILVLWQLALRIRYLFFKTFGKNHFLTQTWIAF